MNNDILPCSPEAQAEAERRSVELPGAFGLFRDLMAREGFIVRQLDLGNAAETSILVIEAAGNALLLKSVRALDDVAIVVPERYGAGEMYIAAVNEAVATMTIELSARAVNLYPEVVVVVNPLSGSAGMTPAELDGYHDYIEDLNRKVVEASKARDKAHRKVEVMKANLVAAVLAAPQPEPFDRPGSSG